MRATHPPGKVTCSWGSWLGVDKQTAQDPLETETYREGEPDSELERKLYCYSAQCGAQSLQLCES